MKISIRLELRHSLHDRRVVTIRTGMMPAITSNPASLAVMQSSLVVSGDSLYPQMICRLPGW